ncbi:MAG: hypothetical protein H6836_09905 [Planctomycetes bacterium]|nr:hypothetical protein [Planctomycetota bacterium]
MLRGVVWLVLWSLASCAVGAVQARGATDPVEDPASAPVIAVLRQVHFELRSNERTWCERITTPGQWRELRQRLGGAATALPDDWCDFDHDCVVVLAAAPARVWPGFSLRTLEEEGVDVVIAAQAGPSGEEIAERSSGLLLVVPRRPAQLAMILRRQIGPAPGAEETVRVFAGL